MRLRRLACLPALAGLLGGCTRYAALPLETEALLERLDRRSAAIVVVEGPGAPQPAVPFDAADGLDERELLALALCLNTELAAARAATGAADALLIEAGLFPNPSLEAGYLAGMPGTGSFQLDGNLMFELLRLGERGARREVAQAAAAEARADVARREYEVVAQVRRQLTAVLAAEQEQALLAEELELRRQARDLVRRRQAAGEANALEEAAADLELADIERSYGRAALEVPQERARLNRLLGLPARYPLRLSDSGKPIEVRLVEVSAAEDLRRALGAGRLDLRHKEAEYRRAEQELRLEVVRQYPSLKVGPAFSHEGPSANYMGLAVALDVPLFQRNQGEIAARLAQRDRVRAEYVDLLHQLCGEADTAALRVASLRQEVEAQRARVLPLLEQTGKLYRRALEARELGVADYLAVQQRALQTRRACLGTLIAYRLALLELDTAVGMTLSGLRPASLPPASTTQPSDPRTGRLP